MEKRIAMIGGGNMAGALVAGLVAAGYPAELIDVMDRNQAKCDRLQKDYGVNTHLKAGEWLKSAEVVVLAVKPQGLSQTISQCKEFFSEGVLYISIAAGIRVGDIARWLGSFNLVRAMPNTPALVKAGVVGLYVPDVALAQKETAQSILCAMGEVITVQSEEQLDLLSTVSGSGPAYVFRFREMAILTVLGAAKLAVASNDSPAQLRINVTSKGGTTAEALRVMDEHRFMDMMDEAVQAAYDRSQVLADELGKS